ncbi:quinone-dependent dihydroorotate dehydrogenase [Alphaproteobacteria bacterium]|nr:quinone-dependent dihydroorotate dehydrogenase [Alphaproteobacteria bacterium]
MIWSFITFLIRKLDPEFAHQLTLKALKLGIHPRLSFLKIPTKINNLIFSNVLGIAAGFDKNAQVIDKIHSLNFGFTEVGTITPLGQYGNPKPRVFRLEKDQAIINRNGFNNLGMDEAKKKLEQYRKIHPVGSDFVLGINIGPNKDSHDRFKDYEILSQNLSQFGDYIAINISSPNTPNLRDFHESDLLGKVIKAVKKGIANSKLNSSGIPIFLKIAPDISFDNLETIINKAVKLKITGLIISNTTIDRSKNLKSKNSKEIGGLSGVPLFNKSTSLLSMSNKIIKNNSYKLYLIAAGGVCDAKTAYVKILCGANLVQLYSSMTFEGPLIGEKIIKGLLGLMKRDNLEKIDDIRGIADNPEDAMQMALNGMNFKKNNKK